MSRCCLNSKCLFANFLLLLSAAFQKMQIVNGEGPKYIYTVSCIGLKFVRCPKITIVSSVTLVKKHAIGFIAFARTKIMTAIQGKTGTI